ncbi:MAG: ABC-2 family transporter protein [Pseudanabaena sp. CoA8_M7]|jgi:ABC-2 type transport system permease protein|nr:ABC-2 family transporter protein [Pseudanabaena mucicola]MCE2976252.1 ABC-2 family transporter protein [Pseudanabaena sp. CoA8_M7]
MKIRYLLRLIGTLFSTYYAYMLEYRAELFIWLLSNSLPFILMGAWLKASENGSFGMTSLEFIRYFLAVFIVRQFNIVWVIWDFEKELISGQLSHRLLQPIDPFWHHLINHIAERWARFPMLVVLIALFFMLYPQSFWIPSLATGLLAAFLVAIAFLLRFLIQYTFGMLAFWTERASAIEQLWFLSYIFLSGIIAPLEVFPPLARDIVLWTPFPYMVYFPSAILVGKAVNIWQGIGVMAGWMAVTVVINRWLWRKGIKQYSGMGA